MPEILNDTNKFAQAEVCYFHSCDSVFIVGNRAESLMTAFST